MAYSSDRNLLVGILALQMDFITRDQLIAGMNAWLLQKSRPLEEILFEQRALSADTLTLLQALVNKHLEIHGNDPQQSLQALSSIEDLRDELQSLADPEVQKTLRFVARPPARIPAEPERFTREIDALCDKFSAALRAGQQPKIEEYLPLLPERAQNELLVELLCEELDWRRRGGEPVEPAEYEARFPHQHAQVARAFQMRSDGRLDSSEVGVGRPSGVRERSKGRFRVIRPHAKGGLGEVFVARDTELNREVALKEIQRKYSDLEESRSRFLLEAEVTGALEHPGIVPVYGLGQYADGRPFYAMRFIQGDSLNEAIAQFHQQHAGAGELTTGEVGVEFRKLLGRFIDVCEAIEYAHSRGVLHRDLKPGNIMLGKYGETLVVDWGLAKVVGRDERYRQEGETTIAPDQGSGSAPTQGAIGTPVYMSPEQAAGRVADLGPATDVYSLGATLYHVLTGRAPFFGNSTDEILRRVQAGDYVKPRELVSQPNSRETKSQPPGAATARGIPPSLEAICVKAMSLRQEDRYPSAAALAADVERFLADEPVSATKEPWRDRLSRWGRRHPSAVGALAAGVLATMVGLTGLTTITSSKNAELRQANTNERTAKLDAETARQEAEQRADEARRNLYVSRMNLAQRYWNEGEASLVSNLLEYYDQNGPDADLRGFEWYYLAREVNSAMTTLRGHSDGVTSVAFSPDGTRLASGSGDNTIKLWDVATAQETATLRGHSESVSSVAFSPDGTRLASGSGDNTIKLWDVSIGQETATLQGHLESVYSVAFSPDGTRLASGSGDNTIKLWDVSTGQETATLPGHSERVYSVAFSPEGTRLASLSRDESIKLWDVSTGQETATLEGIGHSWFVVFSPDGKRLVSGGGFDIKLWNVSTGQEAKTLQEGFAKGFAMCFSSNWTQLASRIGKTIKLWKVSTEQLATLRARQPVATPSWYDDVSIDEQTATLQGHLESVYSVAFSPDGTRLASGSGDNTIKLWDVSTGQETTKLRAWGSQGFNSGAFSPDGTQLASGSGDNTIKLWDVATAQETATLRGHLERVSSVAFSPDGTRLASGSGDNTIKLWDVATAQETATLRGHSELVTSVVFSRDGTRLATGSWDNTIKLWDVATAQETATLRGHSDWLSSLAFSPDGTRLASASSDNTIKLWDISTRQEAATLRGHLASVESVAFNPDGTRLASGSGDNTIKLWDVATAQETATLRGHSERVSSVAFSPDGTRLASGSMSATKLWDVSTGQETATLRGAGVISVSFSSDGTRLTSVSYDTIQIWDARPWTPEIRLEQQALCLVRGMLPQSRSQKLLRAAIENNRAFSPATKQKALEFAPIFWKSQELQRPEWTAAILNEASWTIVKYPNRDAADYQQAFIDAQKSDQLSPDNWNTLNTLGVAQFRVGQFNDALRSLEQSRTLLGGASARGESCDLVFLAMTHYNLGNFAIALDLLGQSREMILKEPLNQDEELQAFLREAEDLIDARPQPPFTPTESSDPTE